MATLHFGIYECETIFEVEVPNRYDVSAMDDYMGQIRGSNLTCIIKSPKRKANAEARFSLQE